MQVNLQQLFEFATIFRFKKRIASTKTIQGKTVLTFCITDKYWKIEGNKLVNKDASWTPEEEWYIKKAPGMGSLKNIENKNKKVLEIPEKNKEGNVGEESYNKNKVGQLWKIGISDDNDYFTIKNKKSSEFLTTDSENSFKVKGTTQGYKNQM